MRTWLGFRPAKFEIILPDFCLTAIAKLADILSWFGWRSPLRSTAVKVLTDGVKGTYPDLTRFGVPQLSSLNQALSNMSVSVQDRLFARMALLTPIIFICLSLFWLTSGIVGIVKVNEAAQVLQDVGWSPRTSVLSVLFWSVVDIAIGVAFALRKHVHTACVASIGVTVFYLMASTFVVPSLWLDPLGPLVKTLPAIVLALVARVVLETR